ncbi:hypothetical protein FACS1894166_13040 [Bacilli bacterium]|nr:hypothetical protein FACS1894166_13040 [Bacilli bacterium]
MVIEAMIGTDVVASVSIGVYKADAQVCVIETNTSSINIGGSTTITGKLSATNFTPTVLNTAIPESVQPNFGSFNFNPVDGTFSVNLLTVVEGAYNLSLISGGIASNNILIHVQSSTTTVVQLSLDNNHLDLFHNETITATVTTTNLSPTGDPTWSPSGHGLTITALDN